MISAARQGVSISELAFVGKAVFSTVIGMGADVVGTELGTKYFGPEIGRYVGLASGLLAGAAAYGGLDILDREVNFTGAYPQEASTVESPVAEASKLYMNSRPSYAAGQVEQVWENAIGTDGKVIDPTGQEIPWDQSQPRNGQWDAGHIPEEKYSVVHEDYMSGKITKEQFLEWYRDPTNYRPELLSTNRGHQFE